VSDAENPTLAPAAPGGAASGSSGGEMELVGYLAEFETVDEILAAAEACRDKGLKAWDCHTPFPVHGLDRAMGVKQTILPWIVLGGGITGCLFGLVLQWFTNVFDGDFALLHGYPFMVSGKPVFSLAIYIPVVFELTILFSALACFVGMLVLNNLPLLYHPVFRSSRFARATDDRFFISIEAADAKFDADATGDFLAGLGAAHVERLEEEKEEAR